MCLRAAGQIDRFLVPTAFSDGDVVVRRVDAHHFRPAIDLFDDGAGLRCGVGGSGTNFDPVPLRRNLSAPSFSVGASDVGRGPADCGSIDFDGIRRRSLPLSSFAAIPCVNRAAIRLERFFAQMPNGSITSQRSAGFSKNSVFSSETPAIRRPRHRLDDNNDRPDRHRRIKTNLDFATTIPTNHSTPPRSALNNLGGPGPRRWRFREAGSRFTCRAWRWRTS